MDATGIFGRVAGSSIVGVALYTPPPGEMGGGEREHAEKPLGNSSEKGTNPGPHSRQSRLPRGDPARPRSSPGWQDRAAAAAVTCRPGAAEDQPPPAARRRRRRRRRRRTPSRMRLAPAARRKATHRTARRPIASSRTCTRHQRQLLSPGKGVRAAARLQGKVLTLPNCSIFRFCCLSAAAGQGMPAGSRGERRGGEAAPDASARRPARRPLRAQRAQRPLPGSAGSAGSAGSGLLRTPAGSSGLLPAPRGSSGLQAPPPPPPPAGRAGRAAAAAPAAPLGRLPPRARA